MAKAKGKQSITATNAKKTRVPTAYANGINNNQRNHNNNPRGRAAPRRSKIELEHLTDAHISQYSESLHKPMRAVNSKQPLSDRPYTPCRTETFSVTGQYEATIPVNTTCLDLYACFEGFWKEEGLEEGPYCGKWNGSTGVYPCPVGAGTVPSVAFIGQYALGVDTYPGFTLPVPGANVFPMLSDSYVAMMQLSEGSDKQSADTVRLVSVGVEFVMLNTQATIEGRIQTVCPYEFPNHLARFGDFRQDPSMRAGVFGSNRTLKMGYWPNCESPQFRQIQADTISAKTVRMRGKISNLKEGDQLLITWKANYEVVRARASMLATVSPVTPSAILLGNAIMTHAGQDGKLAAHVVAHKIIAHPYFSKVRGLAEHALALIGGAKIGPKLISALRGAIAEAPAFLEATAPLLL